MQGAGAQGIDSQRERGADQHEGDQAVKVLKITAGVSLSLNQISVSLCEYRAVNISALLSYLILSVLILNTGLKTDHKNGAAFIDLIILNICHPIRNQEFLVCHLKHQKISIT